jgi:putative hydrolase of the HAD superfamily
MCNKLVIFDCFGVIMNEVAPVFLRKHLPRDKADKIKEELFVPADMGEVTYDELLDNMAKVLGMTRSEMEPQWNAMFSLREEIVPAIRKLREKADIALLSNAPLGVVEGILDRYALWDLFDKTVISCNVKMAKPDEKIYKYCISLFDKQYDKIYMVDDNIVNLEHLPAIGITPIHYKNVEDLDII